jgi:hypothetical protein
MKKYFLFLIIILLFCLISCDNHYRRSLSFNLPKEAKIIKEDLSVPAIYFKIGKRYYIKIFSGNGYSIFEIDKEVINGQ